MAAAAHQPAAAAESGHDGPQRVTFVTTALRHGGAEHQVVLLARGLSQRGWRVGVVSMRPPEAHVEALRDAGVEVRSLDMARRVPDLRAVVGLARVLQEWRPDVVHSHMVHANLLARATRLVSPVPVLISTAHNITEGPRWREVAYRLTEPLCDLTTNVTPAAVARYIRVRAATADAIRHMPNGIDLDRFRRDDATRQRAREALGVRPGQPVLLSVGRFEAAKDHATLIDAMQRVVGGHPDAVLLLVGTGEREPAVRAQAEALGLGGRVRFLGVRDDIPALMNAADVYVMSSAWEGLPLVLLEAAATGLPIVATDVGGNADIVLSQRNGLLCPPRDAAALADAIARVLGLAPATRQAWGATGRAHVEEAYGIERVLDRWEAVYGELWDRAGGAARRTGRRAASDIRPVEDARPHPGERRRLS
ncbi:MAG: glycosyltransferase [Dehalococcoidia bacterium]